MAFYKNYLILVLGILALATNVLAANIKFTAKYNEGLGGHPGSTGKKHREVRREGIGDSAAHWIMVQWSVQGCYQ